MKTSVVMCTWNGAAFIAEQLRSIAQQTCIPDEILIFDDGSTDTTVDIACSVGTQTRLPYVIHRNTRRLGVEQNFSTAMFAAAGDVIFFCDQDDVWKPNRVAHMMTPFRNDPDVTVVYADGEIVGPLLEPSGYTLFTRNPQKELVKGDARDIGEYLKRGKSPGIKASSMAFTRRTRDLAGPIPEGVAHDSWIAVFGYVCGKVMAINEPLYAYRRHNQTAGKSSANQLVPGLTIRQMRPQNAVWQEKLRFVECVYDRLLALERDPAAHLAERPRFGAFKRNLEEARVMLQRRHERAARPTVLNRLRTDYKTLVARLRRGSPV